MSKFKYGQIIRSECTGVLYKVRIWPEDIVSLKDSRTYHARHCCYTLVGNNFQCKPPKTIESTLCRPYHATRPEHL